MNPRPLIDPRLPGRLTPGFFRSICQIKSPLVGASDQDSYGAPHGVTLRQYTVKVGHEAIPCRTEPEYKDSGSRAADTVRQVQVTREIEKLHVKLNGYYPAILDQELAVIDGVPWQIQGITTDGNKVFTQLHVRTIVE